MKAVKLFLSVTFAVLLCAGALLLSGCSDGGGTEYSNFLSGCSIAGKVYTVLYAKVASYNAVTGGPGSLCFDPLCTHDGDSVCAGRSDMWVSDVKTDGKTLFVNLWDVRSLSPEMSYSIYSLDPSTGEMAKLVDYSVVSSSNYISYDDGWLYYTECFYNEEYTVGSSRDTDDSYTVFMRIKTTGGKPERVFAENYPAYSALFLDSGNYYIFGDSLTVINRSTGEKTASDFKTDAPLYLIETEKASYLYCAEIADDHTASKNIYRIDAADQISLAVENVRAPVFDGGVMWDVPLLDEPEYIGTLMLPDGSGKDAPYDYYLRTGGALVKYDLDSGEKTSYAFADRYSSPNLIAVVDGTAIATYENPKEEFAAGLVYVYSCCRIVPGDGCADIDYFDGDGI